MKSGIFPAGVSGCFHEMIVSKKAPRLFLSLPKVGSFQLSTSIFFSTGQLGVHQQHTRSSSGMIETDRKRYRYSQSSSHITTHESCYANTLASAVQRCNPSPLSLSARDFGVAPTQTIAFASLTPASDDFAEDFDFSSFQDTDLLFDTPLGGWCSASHVRLRGHRRSRRGLRLGHSSSCYVDSTASERPRGLCSRGRSR